MHQGLKDLLLSERGTFCILLVLAATALVITGKLDTLSWIGFMKWIAITLVASKTITGAVETVTGTSAPAAATTP